MKKEILLSVLMPVYNTQKYLKSAIESVLAQTFSDFELLIIDDGSTDNSLNIIREYADKDCRIKYLSRENKGLVTTLNELVNMASAEIVARMDGDDTIMPERFSEQFEIVSKGGDKIICGSWVQTTNQLNEIWHYRQADNFTKNLLLTGVTPLCHASLMCTRKLLKSNPFQKEFEYLEDYALFCQLTAEDKVFFYNIPKVLYFYNIHLESICGQKLDIQNQKRAIILKRFINELLNVDVDITSCIDFLFIRNEVNISFNQLVVAGDFLEKLVNVPTSFKDEYYTLSELLLSLILKCNDQEQAKKYWYQHALYPTQFIFLRAYTRDLLS